MSAQERVQEMRDEWRYARCRASRQYGHERAREEPKRSLPPPGRKPEDNGREHDDAEGDQQQRP